MSMLSGVFLGLLAWFIVRFVFTGFYIVNQNQRAVKTVFGRAQRIENKTTLDDPISELLREDEQSRYAYPQLRVIQPGGPYFKWPWEKVYKVSIATETVNMAFDPEDRRANNNNTVLDAVTKDQLNIGLTGQIRFRVSERNLYAYIFGVKNPLAHVMGYFVSVLRERISNFEAPESEGNNETPAAAAQGISINDLRKNLRDLNDHMDKECQVSVARYGVVLEASLITGIDPPAEVESALAAINTAHNQVSSDISLAQAAADQKVVQSKRAVEIETLNAEAEVEKLNRLAQQLSELKTQGSKESLDVYLRNVKLSLLDKTKRIIKEG
ncbi:SPFH domain-containing protein [Acetivibrio cellulolyticus]|uniref:SPFH domain-containing protein n=1 Tax=Acetivibrio cellulolyticus TaxID=35830 RepID=UPI0001E2EC36|nr:SPFH domain-containing protein [Acetivibrio cellulolyticus]